MTDFKRIPSSWFFWITGLGFAIVASALVEILVVFRIEQDWANTSFIPRSIDRPCLYCLLILGSVVLFLCFLIVLVLKELVSRLERLGTDTLAGYRRLILSVISYIFFIRPGRRAEPGHGCN